MRKRLGWIKPEQNAAQPSESIHIPSYALKTPAYYLSQLDPQVLERQFGIREGQVR